MTYRLEVSTAVPLTVESPHALQVTSTGSGSGAEVGVTNAGFWGISLINETAFTVSLWAYSATVTTVTAALTSADRSVVYAQTSMGGVGKQWSRLNATLALKAGSDDAHAVFSLSWPSGGGVDALFLDVVTLFPTTGWRGLPFIRSDLSEMIAAIHPSIVRLPGGSYIDGVDIAGRFEWNNTLFGLEHRPGHAGLWGYFSTDGMGIFEYFSWVEKLTDVYGNPSRVVWVVNAGVSYGGQTITPDQLDGWAQDAINSVEFATGAVSTPYGAIRAAMGHPAPFTLDYLAIGNENCQGSGAPTYLKYYPVLFARIKAAYPALSLIANCNQSALGAFDLYDWHTYPSPNQMYGMGREFDHYDPNQQLFVSEYAARGGDALNGTLDAALSEAVFMCGMEVNSHVIRMASYAPLFGNANALEWIPDAIYFTSSQAYGTPSYWTQILFANSFQGLQAPPRTVQFSAPETGAAQFAASVTVGALSSDYSRGKGGASTAYIVKMVNFAAQSARVNIDLQGLPASARYPAPADLAVLSSPTGSRTDMNTFAHIRQIAPHYSTVNVQGAALSVELPAYSVAVLRVYVLVSNDRGAAVEVQ